MTRKRRELEPKVFEGELPPIQSAKDLEAKYSPQANARMSKLEQEIAANAQSAR
jgi:hypothetical protein